MINLFAFSLYFSIPFFIPGSFRQSSCLTGSPTLTILLTRVGVILMYPSSLLLSLLAPSMLNLCSKMVLALWGIASISASDLAKLLKKFFMIS